MNYEYIDNLIKEKGISRRKLAELANISPNTLSANFRRKTKNVPIDTIMKIAEVLETEWWKIADYEEYGGDFYGKEADESVYKKIDESYNRDFRLEEIMKAYYCLNDEGKQEAVKRIEELCELSRYRR